MRLITIQNKSVLDTLKDNKIYYADFDKISFSNYKKQWKELAKYLGFNECPIFCSPIDNDEASTASNVNGVKITLDVPDEECHVMDYYGFADWLYYSSGQEYDSYFNWGADKALKNIDKYLDKDAKIVQVVINRIDPKWVDWNLTEATRQQLISKSQTADKTKSYGTTRYDRRNMQHVYSPKESLNKLDQNALWKSNILSFYMDIHGETNNYKVEVIFDDVLGDFKKELERNKYKLEYKVIYRAIINAINRQDIYVSCTCADFYYTFSYQATKERYNAGKSVVIPAKVRNPNNTKGAGCKHILKVLADLSWALDLATCITNYIYLMQDRYPDKYEEIIFPALYGMSYIEAINKGIIEVEEETFDDIEDIEIEEEPQDEEPQEEAEEIEVNGEE